MVNHKCTGPGRGRVGEFQLYGTQESIRPGDVTGEQRMGGTKAHVGKY